MFSLPGGHPQGRVMGGGKAVCGRAKVVSPIDEATALKDVRTNFPTGVIACLALAVSLVASSAVAAEGEMPAGTTNIAPVLGDQITLPQFIPDPLEHGGKRDTSFALASLDAPLVDPGFAKLEAKPREGGKLGRTLQYLQGNAAGYWGAPAGASAEEGQRGLASDLDVIFPKLRAVWEGADPNALFRSYYSVLPPNKSFFRAWVLAIFIALFIGFWAYLNVAALLDGS